MSPVEYAYKLLRLNKLRMVFGPIGLPDSEPTCSCTGTSMLSELSATLIVLRCSTNLKLGIQFLLSFCNRLPFSSYLLDQVAIMAAELEKQASFEATTMGLLYRQFTRPKPLPAGIKLKNQVAIITGSNVGLGFEASRQLLQLGLSHLVMGVRSQTKGDAAAALLRTAFPSATISVWILDMESYDSIRAFVIQCESLPRIDIVILNAGFMNTTCVIAPTTKHEVTIQVNYLSTALLAILLLPLLTSKRVVGVEKPPVLTIVGSDAAYGGATIGTESPILQQFDDPKTFSSITSYSASKLFLVLFVSKLAEIVSSDEVLISVVNPGMTKGTAFFHRFPAVFAPFVSFIQFLFARSLAVGAATYVHAAVAEGKESHGAFLSDWAIRVYV